MRLAAWYDALVPLPVFHALKSDDDDDDDDDERMLCDLIRIVLLKAILMRTHNIPLSI